MLRKYIDSQSMLSFSMRMERIENDYQLMKDYMRRGLKDPQFESVYQGLLRALYCLNSDVQLGKLVKENPSYMSAHHQAGSLDKDHGTIKKKLEAFVQDVTMLSLEAGQVQHAKKQELYSMHQQYLNALFSAIVVSPQWSDSTAQFAKDMFLSPTIDTIDAQLLMGGLTLSTIQLFDIRKFQTLVWVYQNAMDQHLRQRALVGVVLSLPGSEGNIFSEMKGLVDSLCNDEHTCRALIELQMQFFYCMKADEDHEKIKKDIMPNLMKGSRIDISRIGMIEKEEDVLQEILNPGAADQAMEELEKNFNQMLNMQKAGSDIYFGGFSQMKRFAFFASLSNWFVPFYEEHPGLQTVKDKLGNSQFMNLLLENGPFCDSDKYSFALAMSSVIDQIPENMRELLNNQEAIGPTVSVEDKKNPAYIRRMYLQDLYRFYRIYTNKQDFQNPFHKEVQENGAFFVMSSYFRDSPLKNKMIEMGWFLYKHRFYHELEQLLVAYVDRDDVEYWRLRALSYYKAKDYLEADLAYGMVLEQLPNDAQAIRGKAQTSFYLENYEQAVQYNKQLLEQDTSNKRVQLNLAVAFINNGEIEEGMKYLFKLNYEHPEDLAVQRSLAWGYLRQMKPELAEPVYRRLLANQHHLPTDCLNAGYCMWFVLKTEEALSLFRQYEQEAAAASSHEYPSLDDSFVLDAVLLKQYNIGVEETFVMQDLVHNA